jgi:hypothetical protein
MMTWSHSSPVFPPKIIYKHTQLIGKIWRWGEEPKGPFPKIAHQTLWTVRGFWNFIKLYWTLAPQKTNWTILEGTKGNQPRVPKGRDQEQSNLHAPWMHIWTNDGLESEACTLCKIKQCLPQITQKLCVNELQQNFRRFERDKKISDRYWIAGSVQNWGIWLLKFKVACFCNTLFYPKEKIMTMYKLIKMLGHIFPPRPLRGRVIVQCLRLQLYQVWMFWICHLL